MMMNTNAELKDLGMPASFDITSIMTWLVAAAASVTAGIALWKSVLFPTLKYATTLAKVLANLEDIKQQLKPNGGSSLRDAIDRIETRIILAEQRAKFICMDGPIAVFETDGAGNFIHTNRTLTRWTGRAPDDFLGAGWVNAVIKTDRSRVFTEWHSAVTQKREFDETFCIAPVTGASFEVNCSAFPMVDAKEGVTGWIGIISRV